MQKKSQTQVQYKCTDSIFTIISYQAGFVTLEMGESDHKPGRMSALYKNTEEITCNLCNIWKVTVKNNTNKCINMASICLLPCLPLGLLFSLS